jgi:hypothetical protein
VEAVNRNRTLALNETQNGKRCINVISASPMGQPLQWEFLGPHQELVDEVWVMVVGKIG